MTGAAPEVANSLTIWSGPLMRVGRSGLRRPVGDTHPPALTAGVALVTGLAAVVVLWGGVARRPAMVMGPGRLIGVAATLAVGLG